VVLPVYNGERYVGAAIHSILAQTEGNFELIVINDGSTDDSLSAVHGAIAGDSRCKVVDRPNCGLVHTLNEGLSLATGAFIARMDADDIARPARFARQLAHLQANPSCVAVGSRVLLIDPEGLPLMEMIDAYTHSQIDSANLSLRASAICHPTVMMRRDAVLAVGGYRAAYDSAEDLDLFLRLAEIGQLANLPEVLLEYRQHLASVGYAKALEQRRLATAAIAEAGKRRKLPAREWPAEASVAPLRRPVDEYRKWTWWALLGGHPATARKYALRSVKADPFKLENFRLVACALRGR
jgi:glycosyltransferase involved in cell wall biosynthesis